MFPEISRSDVLSINTDQMIEVDRAMVEDYNIGLIQMMENAGRNLAHLARQLFLNGNPSGKTVLVMAGSGGNGGGALVAARRLSNWGAKVSVALGRAPGKLTHIPARQLDILQRMGVAGSGEAAVVDDLAGRHFDLILDGLIGYSLNGAPYGLIGELINYANKTETPVLSLDTPSGVDTTSGTIYNPAIEAAATLTLALPKDGLFAGANQAGALYLADISVPPELYATSGLSVGTLFAQYDILRIV